MLTGMRSGELGGWLRAGGVRTAGARRPSAVEPVIMSCVLGWSLMPLTIVPFSVREFSLVSLLLSLCRSATLAATCNPLKLYQGPLPIRSRACTSPVPFSPAALRYARQVLLPAPTAAASLLQCASAPFRPPR